MKRPLLLFGTLASIAVIVAAWYLLSPLFINKTVNEEFPAQIPTPQELAKMSQEELMKTNIDNTKIPPTVVVEEPMPSSLATPTHSRPTPSSTATPQEPIALLQGEFKGKDSFHAGSGKAAIFMLSDDKRIVRFENFSVTNGPDLRVILSSNASPQNREELEANGYVELGALKGNVGNQNYDIPPDVDITKYKSVVIYCKPFHVVFATADLR